MRYLTPEEVAKIFLISEATLATWRSRGGGPAFHKFGGRVRYLDQDVESWAKERRQADGIAGKERTVGIPVPSQGPGCEQPHRLGGHRRKSQPGRSGEEASPGPRPAGRGFTEASEDFMRSLKFGRAKDSTRRRIETSMASLRLWFRDIDLGKISVRDVSRITKLGGSKATRKSPQFAR